MTRAAIIGLDPSFTCTGVAVWTDNGVKTFSVKTKAGQARAHREMAIVDAVMPWVVCRPIAAAMVEGVFASRFGGRTSLDLAGLHDVLVYEFARRGIPVGEPQATSNKRFATLNGDASKKDMVAAAKALLGITVANHNEADALWLAVMGLVAMGGQLNNWPPRSDHPLSVANQKVREDCLRQIGWVGRHPGLLTEQE